MEPKEKNEVTKLVEANFSAARKKVTTTKGATKGIESCNCDEQCTCPGGSGSAGGVQLDATVVGYAGGYAGSLAYYSGLTD